MKQEMITFLNTIKGEIFELTKYLYNNPEESFHEYKSYNYISSLLKKYQFKVTPSYLDIPTSFYAKYGEGHPKICFLCEYDAIREKGHVYGYNAETAISTASAIALSNVISKIGGSTIVIGCPGEIISGSKVTMVEQGTFDDIDAVLMVQPHTITAVSGNSMAIIPLEIKYTDNPHKYDDAGKYSSLDACLFTFDALNVISKGFENNCFISDINVNSINNSFPQSVEAKFSIKTSSSKIADEIQNKLKNFIDLTCHILNVSSELHLYNMPCKELITNSTLSRLFSHNLKESGIIDINGVKNIFSSLNLGNVSHIVPCIHPYVSIVKDSNSITYGTKQFAEATVTTFANEVIMKAAQALACTAFDIIEKQSLIADAKTELSKIQTNMQTH